jgi:two-component system sensor histidine kinase/response regulator
VLVIDESATNQLITAGMVEYLGYQSSVAADEVQALIALARTRFDAVLIDCRAPADADLATIAEIRRFHGSATHVPVVAMTTSDDDRLVAELRAAGVDDHVTRPISLEALGTTLERWMSRAERV